MVMSSTFVVLSKLFELPLSIGHGCRISQAGWFEYTPRIQGHLYLGDTAKAGFQQSDHSEFNRMTAVMTPPSM
jgi:hypothetical protein